ncbi:hypothetical protein BB559_007155 [Furculomyces boomerangus]|uniref:Ribosomal protein L15 n=2 Tax=Harpellales TaxID=61421 RepID=A0A2T9XYP6_9FUNG|nr:hypothetical protein BB559_007155 [Furculomyces boomerangus]PWA01493.1 hypothetical protein BB558_002403 [Smittium angustum]
MEKTLLMDTLQGQIEKRIDTLGELKSLFESKVLKQKLLLKEPLDAQFFEYKQEHQQTNITLFKIKDFKAYLSFCVQNGEVVGCPTSSHYIENYKPAKLRIKTKKDQRKTKLSKDKILESREVIQNTMGRYTPKKSVCRLYKDLKVLKSYKVNEDSTCKFYKVILVIQVARLSVVTQESTGFTTPFNNVTLPVFLLSLDARVVILAKITHIQQLSFCWSLQHLEEKNTLSLC